MIQFKWVNPSAVRLLYAFKPEFDDLVQAAAPSAK